MKTRFLVIVGISVTVFLIGTVVYPYINKTTFDDDFSHNIKTSLDDAPSVPEPARNPVPEGTHVDKNTFAYSVKDAESYLNYTLSIPYIPEGINLEKIKISSDRKKATIYYSNGLEMSHYPMGKNFNNTHYIENPARPENKVFYDFNGTFAEGLQINDPFYSVITIHRNDRIYVKAVMETDLDDLLKIIEPMDLNVPRVPYTPDPWYVMGTPEPTPEAELEPITPPPEPEKNSEFSKLTRNEKRVIIEGEMADQICTITKGECPSYYIGNIQEDGSVMVGMTFSDTVKEKQFIFFIKNNTLSYEIKK